MLNTVTDQGLHNSIKMDFSKHAASSHFEELCKIIYNASGLQRLSHQLERGGKQHRERMLNVLNALVGNLYAAWRTNPRTYLAYSRGKPSYIQGGRYWDWRARKPEVSLRDLTSVINAMAQSGFVDSHVAAANQRKISSRVRAGTKLIRFFERPDFNLADISASPDSGLIIMKDADKNHIPLPEDAVFDIDRAWNRVARVNKQLAGSLLNLRISDAEFRNLGERMRRRGSDDMDLEQTDFAESNGVDFTDRKIRRIFAQESFSMGGRLYGGWWQTIPSEYRQHIEIDGVLTVECDYATMQPRILYAQAETDPPKDSYLVPGWPSEIRPIAKKAFAQLINCKPAMSSPGRWYQLPPFIDPDPIPKQWGNWLKSTRTKHRRTAFHRTFGRPYDDLLADLLEFHKPIQNQFFSGAWGRMQRMDSDIAESVMLRMQDHGYTVLPVHDSFIVRLAGYPLLHRIMGEAFKEVVGVEPKIDTDSIIDSSILERCLSLSPDHPDLLQLESVDMSEALIGHHSTYLRNIKEWQSSKSKTHIKRNQIIPF